MAIGCNWLITQKIFSSDKKATYKVEILCEMQSLCVLLIYALLSFQASHTHTQRQTPLFWLISRYAVDETDGAPHPPLIHSLN